MTEIRLIAISADNPPDYSGDIWRVPERDCFVALATALGVSVDTLMNRLRDYSALSVEIVPNVIIKAHLLHKRYSIGKRTDRITVETVGLAWIKDSTNGLWQQVSNVRETISEQRHYKTDDAFENAVNKLIAEHLSAVLENPDAPISNIGDSRSYRHISKDELSAPNSTQSKPPALSVNSTEKKPSFSSESLQEKAQSGKKKPSNKKRRHGRGRR